jgi:uncharacterized Rossmann fold enzyme
MDFDKWRPWYERILTAFSFDWSEDAKSADLLEKLLEGKAILPSAVQRIVEGENAVVFGFGPSLERNLNEYLTSGLKGRSISIAADGATTSLLRGYHLVPEIVVTDLDGDVGDLVDASKKGSVVVIHAHGDNKIPLMRHVPKFGSVLGSTQVEARPHVYNFGGFTDGDRAAFLAEEVGARRVILLEWILARLRENILSRVT